ncbi:hypothetical protein PVAND_009386 [Polypedilum vanderplanki]|uniref:ABC transporter domain-containing protein n=1 Tax=Polypedilum vanderplanki TaxID=319348 RepID=A0A9J6CCF7_POLVA|nr:hypothetical protein PVAND_009386 [Polypedilum vanderplanki]
MHFSLKLFEMSSIQVRKLSKNYQEFGKNSQNILCNFNLTIKYGSIYSLVGSSGCGKTTFLNCLLAMQKIDEGEIKIFNQQVKFPNLKSLSKLIGFMPQHIALASQLTINETFHYFASLQLIDDKTLKERSKMLCDLLCLPSKDSLIGKISNGQQRRVSFAVAVLHDPKLLILDEPTVGLDCEIRQRIWKFLHQQSSEKNITILFTTQYLTEVSRAHCCGFLRKGNLIVENSHDKILEQFNVDNIDEAFYQICCLDESKGILKITANENNDNYLLCMDFLDKSVKDNKIIRWQVLKGLLIKEWHRKKISHSENFVAYLLPIFYMIIYMYAIGGFPNKFKFGIVNYETSECGNYQINNSINFNHCQEGKLSCEILNNLDYFEIINYDQHQKAYEDFLKGEIFGFLIFNSNFTKSLTNVLHIYHTFEIISDPTQYAFGLYLKYKLFLTFSEVFKNLSTKCEIIGGDLLSKSMNIRDIITNNFDIFIMNYQSVVMILILIFCITMSHSVLSIYEFRGQGIWNRSVINGMKISEIVLAQLILFYCNTFIIIIEMLLVIKFVLKIEILGSIWLVAFMIYQASMGGYIVGFLTSILVDDIFVLAGLANAFIAVSVSISGLVWPIEAASIFIKPVAYIYPVSLSGIALREIIFKGSNLYHFRVQIALIYIIVCGLILSFVSYVLLKWRKFTSN